ncbi:MAG: hypothetical protein PHE55_08315 [Methylococcaceae bacterium]|nr:hypothetical protein [Methylococcaceae bacterium]
MQKIEKYKVWILLALAALALAAFITRHNSGPNTDSSVATPDAALFHKNKQLPKDEGTCDTPDGTSVTCYIPGQTYTYKTRSKICASSCG